MEQEQIKICPKCKKELLVSMFSKDRSSNDGLCYMCKNCMSEYRKRYAEKSGRKEKLREAARRSYRRNSEKAKERANRYYSENKEDVSKKQKLYRKNNKETIKEASKKYRQKPENKERQRTYGREYYHRRKDDELFYFKSIVRHLIRYSFVRKGFEKSGRTEDIVGLPFDKFREYLLLTFKKNYGYDWDGEESVHIDHKIPLATAKSVDDIIKLCHWENLQLLKASDNLAKKDKENFSIFS